MKPTHRLDNIPVSIQKIYNIGSSLEVELCDDTDFKFLDKNSSKKKIPQKEFIGNGISMKSINKST